MSEEKDEKSAKKQKKKVKRKVLAGATAFTAAVGVFVSSLFGTPNDLLADPVAGEPPAIVMEIGTDDDAEEELLVDDDEKKTKLGFFARIRAVILGLPLFVRVAAGLPLWALGWLVTQGFSALWKLFLAPAAERILTFLITALVLLAVMTLLLKIIFPALPLKKILSRTNILIIVIGCAVLCVLNFILDKVTPDFGTYEYLIRFGEGLLLLLIALCVTAIRSSSRQGR